MRRVFVAAKAFFQQAAPAILAAALGLIAISPGVALAQAASPPVRSSVDENGVDLTSGKFNYSAQEVSIGQPNAGGLSYTRNFVGDGWRDNLTGTISQDRDSNNDLTNFYRVSFGPVSERFELVSGAFVQAEGSQSTLSFDAGTGKYTYSNSGVVMIFDTAYGSQTVINGVQTDYYQHKGRITSITYPTGETVTFHYKMGVLVDGVTPTHRLQSVTNNLGYHIKFTYGRNAAPTTSGEQQAWFQIASVTGINGAVDYCDPAADSCTYSVTWPTATYVVPTSTMNLEVTDALSRTTKYIQGSGNGFNVTALITGIRRPTSPSTNNVTIAYDSSDRVYTMSNGIGTWTYGYSDSAGVFTTTKTDPLSKVWTYKSQSGTGLLLSAKDPLNREITYAYDDKGRMIRVTRPEGDADEYAYDARGNVTQVTRKAKPGSGLADITTSTTFASSCTGTGVTCNLPITATTATGKVIDYTFDTTHGGALTVTAPSPGGGAARPQTRYSYTALYAWYKDSSGTLVQAPTPVYKLTGTSVCSTGSSCPAAATELKTTITYGAASVKNNLLPTSVAKGSGDGALTATTVTTYDDVGNTVAVDGPLSGTTDTVRYRYDAGRQRIGVINPDPDGATVTLKNRATRYTYNADGQITLMEEGTVDGILDADWAAYATLTKKAFTYDALGRVTKSTLESGSTTYAVTQYSYDNVNRTDCVAVRMNGFTSLPAACSLSTVGANGYDRITKNSYDAAGQLIKVTDGYGTSGQRDVVSVAYTANGKQATQADAKGNLTSFTYDGFDRPWRIFYPDLSTPIASSATDYEQFSYDAYARLIEERRRNGDVFGISYDDLNRPTAIDAPTGMEDVSATYDNLGRMLTKAQTSQTLTSTYDILSRKLSEQGPLGTVAYEYDLAGRRTKMTWPDTFYVTYTYDDAGYPKNIRQNGSTSSANNLATFSYTTLGSLKSITRANTAGTSFGLDAVGRPTTIVQNLLNTADDITYTLGWNPAFQVKSRAGSNSNYALSGLSAVNRPYTINGLNQIATSGASPSTLTLDYDDSGNMISDGVNDYTYDQSNRITGMPSIVSLLYDPAGRLYQVGTGTKFLYDGANIIAEYNSAGTTVLRKYVHGPGADQPLVWLEGSDASTRRWLIADQIGSIVAVTDGTGAAINVNKYDEFGIPASGNVGRFQYTGQSWIPELGLYNYKARAYAPTLGRFLQPDPSKYIDGPNMYNYVSANPVSARDPTGRTTVGGVTVRGICDWDCVQRLLNNAAARRAVERLFMSDIVLSCGGNAAQAVDEIAKIIGGALKGQIGNNSVYIMAQSGASVGGGVGVGGYTGYAAQVDNTGTIVDRFKYTGISGGVSGGGDFDGVTVMISFASPLGGSVVAEVSFGLVDGQMVFFKSDGKIDVDVAVGAGGSLGLQGQVVGAFAVKRDCPN